MPNIQSATPKLIRYPLKVGASWIELSVALRMPTITSPNFAMLEGVEGSDLNSYMVARFNFYTLTDQCLGDDFIDFTFLSPVCRYRLTRFMNLYTLTGDDRRIQ